MHSVKRQLVKDKVATDLQCIILSILDACVSIADQISHGELSGILGDTQHVNSHGETQKKMDIVANELLKKTLSKNIYVKAIASEEEASIIPVNKEGNYLVAFDPLDGSSNIDINGQVGTIFSIMPSQINLMDNVEEQFFQQGRNQVCSGYVLYGSACLLVMTTGDQVHCFTLDPLIREFILTKAKLQIPEATQEFSVNIANDRFWSPKFRAYIAELLLGETGLRKKRYNMRWNGSMVGDVHRILIRGGIFLYPSDNRDSRQPAKLRLLYEGNPIAFLVSAAGGKAMTEDQPILDVVPESLHQRIPIILGSSEEVTTCLEYLL